MLKTIHIVRCFCLFAILYYLPTVPVHAQCHNANVKEQKVYNDLVKILKEEFYFKIPGKDWDAGAVLDAEGNLEVSDHSPFPPRPLFICNAQQFDFSLTLKPDAALSVKIADSLKWYDSIYQNNTCPIMTDGQWDMKKFSALPQVERDKITAASNFILERKQLLVSSKEIKIKTEINDPFFYISSPRSGFVALRYKKINVPGCPLAYVISFDAGTASSPCRMLLGFGNWQQKMVDNNGELLIDYHFTHHYPAAVIENIVIEIDLSGIDEGMKLLGRVNWDKLNQALSH